MCFWKLISKFVCTSVWIPHPVVLAIILILYLFLVDKTGLDVFFKKIVRTAPTSVSKLQQYIRDPSQTEDLIATATTIAGFEWPSILMITSTVYESEFHVRNIVMRSMCKLVWLKTTLIDQLHELNVSLVKDSFTPGRIG